MNEEYQEEIIESQESEKAETALIEQQKSKLKPIFSMLAIIGVIIVGGLIFWVFRNREGGQSVPAPRTVSFEPDNNKQISPTTEEQTITLQPEQAKRIGLKIETVGETLSSETITSTGVVQPNAYAETPVISVVGGIVRQVKANLGETVRKGQTVAIIFSDELALAESRYLALQTEAQTAQQNYQRAAKLVKLSPVSNAELDEALAKLKIAQAELEEHHKHHERIMKLVEIGAASREEFEMARTKLKTAEANLEEADQRYDRAIKVAQINPTGNSEFEQAAVKLRTAETELASTKQRLLLLGLSPQSVSALRVPSQISSEVALTAPVSGTLTSRVVNPGAIIQANQELMKVTNLATVWVIAQVYEKDLKRLQAGSGASVTTDAYPGKLFRGRVSYIDPNINQETRTGQVRVELENAGQIFKIGMYVNIAFGSLGTAEKTTPVISSVAVQNLGNQQIVFLTTDDPNKFILKPVRLGTESGGQLIVLEGLQVGDKIVTEGSFLLRAEWLKAHPEN